MNVRLHIDRLVLDGVAVSDRARLAASLEAELAHLIATRGLEVGQGMAVPSVRAPEIAMGAPLCRSLAHSIHGALQSADGSGRKGSR